MQEILSLPENWDSYGGRAIDPETVISTLQLLDAVMRPDTPLPAVVPTNRGGIQLEWHTRGIDLEIQISARARSHVYYHDQAKGIEWEQEVAFDLNPLVKCIRQLSRRRDHA
jgi:hypothetical protein